MLRINHYPGDREQEKRREKGEKIKEYLCLKTI